MDKKLYDLAYSHIALYCKLKDKVENLKTDMLLPQGIDYRKDKVQVSGQTGLESKVIKYINLENKLSDSFVVDRAVKELEYNEKEQDAIFSIFKNENLPCVSKSTYQMQFRLTEMVGNMLLDKELVDVLENKSL